MARILVSPFFFVVHPLLIPRTPPFHTCTPLFWCVCIEYLLSHAIYTPKITQAVQGITLVPPTLYFPYFDFHYLHHIQHQMPPPVSASACISLSWKFRSPSENCIFTHLLKQLFPLSMNPPLAEDNAAVTKKSPRKSKTDQLSKSLVTRTLAVSKTLTLVILLLWQIHTRIHEVLPRCTDFSNSGKSFELVW